MKGLDRESRTQQVSGNEEDMRGEAALMMFHGHQAQSFASSDKQQLGHSKSVVWVERNGTLDAFEVAQDATQDELQAVFGRVPRALQHCPHVGRSKSCPASLGSFSECGVGFPSTPDGSPVNVPAASYLAPVFLFSFSSPGSLSTEEQACGSFMPDHSGK
eukprot:4383560-Amphidinium_carterae.1